VNGPHAERGHFSLGYWSTADWAANLTVERLEQLLRIETAAITKHRSLLAWCEGRAAGLRNELTRRREMLPVREPIPASRHAVRGLR
jgi:hypothetical protein